MLIVISFIRNYYKHYLNYYLKQEYSINFIDFINFINFINFMD